MNITAAARKATLVGWLATVMTAGMWAAQPAAEPVSTRATAPAVVVMEHNAFVDRVDAAISKAGAVKVDPMKTPSFIPRAAIVINKQAGTIKTVSFDVAFTGKAGQIVAWIR